MPLFGKRKGSSEAELLRPHFDMNFYRAKYPDRVESELDPVQHYLAHGAIDGFDPTPWFSTNGYLNAYPDVLLNGVNPFVHYVSQGREEGRALPWLNTERVDDLLPFTPHPRADPAEQMMRYLIWHHDHRHETLSSAQAYSRGQEIVEAHVATGLPLYQTPNDLALLLHANAVRHLFDVQEYRRNHPDLVATAVDPLLHYCADGWRDLGTPAPKFDAAWYTLHHLKRVEPIIDPLLHYCLLGEEAGLATRHSRRIVIDSPGVNFTDVGAVRRACLFAGHDPHGVIDETVLRFLLELSRFAEIYYVTDIPMSPTETAKLDGIAKATWCLDHETPPAQAHAKLLENLIGWEQIETYDEVIMTDDCAYLVGELEPIFTKMDSLSTDWWGLSARYGTYKTRREDRERFPTPAAREDIQDAHLQDFEDAFEYRFAVGPSFVVLRHPVLRDPDFRDFVRALGRHAGERAVIEGRDAKLTQLLIQLGYKFEIFTGQIHPHDPTLTEQAFSLIANGYPFFSRALLTRNPYHTLGLESWWKRLAEVAPDADIKAIERHLDRTCDPLQLHVSLHMAHDADLNPIRPSFLNAQEFEERDAVTTKRDDWWVFPACAYDRSLSGNDRAIFEEVRHDPTIRKIVLTRGHPIDLDGANVAVYPLFSRAGQEALLQSRVILTKHSPSVNTVFPLSIEDRLFIGLWHGIPFKKIGTASLDTINKREDLKAEHAKLACVIASSPIDQLAMSAGFQPLALEDIWVTGLPRQDFLIRTFDSLPRDFQHEESRLREQLCGKRLILLCPTFRNDTARPGFQFTQKESSTLDSWLTSNNAVLGIREHMADRQRSYSGQLIGPNVMPLSSADWPNIEALYRVSDCLITDYSSCFFDYMLTGKAAISFAYDLESYCEHERGAFYDLEEVFPGPVCRTVPELVEALDAAAKNQFANSDPLLDQKRRQFFSFEDDENAKRVVARIKELLACNGQ